MQEKDCISLYRSSWTFRLLQDIAPLQDGKSMNYGQLKILSIWGTFSEDVDKRNDVIDLLEICSFKVCGTKYVKGTLEFFCKVLLTHFMLDEWNRYHNSSVLRKLSPIGEFEKALWLGLSKCSQAQNYQLVMALKSWHIW